MTEDKAILETTVIRSDDGTKVYEIIRDNGRKEGEEIILLTLFPTHADPGEYNSTAVHLLNHAADEGLNLGKIHFVFLFSTVARARLSTRGLKVDWENLSYLRKLVKDNPNAKVIVSFGASMQHCPAAIESKTEFFKMFEGIRPGGELWQLDAPGMEEEAPHVLFAGIKYGSAKWSLAPFKIPSRYTKEGFEAYLKKRQEEKNRHVKGVFGAVSAKDCGEAVEDNNEKGYFNNANRECENNNKTEYSNNTNTEYADNNEKEYSDNDKTEGDGNAIIHNVKKRKKKERTEADDQN